MSFPTIPPITPAIRIDRTQIINLLLASIAFEELGLAHIINAEGEKLQAALGNLPDLPVAASSFNDLITIDREVRKTLQTIIKKEMLLQFKLEGILEIPPETPAPPTPEYEDVGSAWSVGTDFGTGNAQYTTLGAEEDEKTVVLGLGANHIPIGTVHLLRQGNNLEVTIATVDPYVMDQVHLYVSNAAPVNSNPGGFPYQFTVNDPALYFTSHTFVIDVSAFVGQTLYIAAHAHILQPVV